MNNKTYVLSITLVTGEDTKTEGLPLLKVYKGERSYCIFDDDKAINKAIIESIEHLEEPNQIEISLAVKIIPGEIRTRRQTKGGEA